MRKKELSQLDLLSNTFEKITFSGQSQKDPTYGLGCVSKEKRRNGREYWYYTYYIAGKRYRKYICSADKSLPPEYREILQSKRDYKGSKPEHATR